MDGRVKPGHDVPEALNRLCMTRAIMDDNMVWITYRNSSREETTVDVSPGLTLMEAARNNGVAGILADCGGACSCSTCHVYVDDKWICCLPEKSELETSMLEFALDVDERRSRLSCRIEITAELDGLLVEIPARQV